METEASDELNPTKFNEPIEARWPRFASIGLGVIVFIGGVISFLGWLADIPRFADWDGGGIHIQPNTTVAAAAAGLALILVNIGYCRIAAGFAAFVGMIGVTSLFQNLFNADLGINSFLTFGREWGKAAVAIPGLMGIPASTSWTLTGTAIVLFSIFSKKDHPEEYRAARSTAVTLAIVALAISSLSLIGYLYGARALYAITSLTAIAFQTALFILSVSLGLIFGISESGPMRLFSDPGPAGILTRRLVPPLIMLPVLIGAIRLIGERAGLYDQAFGTAIRTLTEIALLLTIVWWAGKAVDRQAKRVEETQKDLKRLADAMPQVVWMSDKTGAVEYYNERASNFAGIYLEYGKHDWQPGVHPDDVDETVESWNEAVRKGEVYAREHRIQMADGSFRWHLSRAVPTPSSNGSEQKWFGTATDIHDLKIAEHALRESEQRFSRFMQNLPGLAWIKDREGHYVFANEAAQVAFGKTGAELYGKTDHEIFDAVTADGFVENDRLAFMSASGRQTVEALKDEAGNVRYSLVNKFPIHVNGEPSLIGGMAIDITEQKIAQDNQEFLFRIADRIRLSRNAEDLLAEISEELGKFLDVHRCLFNEIDLDNDLETVHRDYTRTGESVAGEHKISDYSTVNSDAMAAGNTIVNKDSKNDPRTAEYFDKTYGPNRELAYVAVPMLRDGKWVASLWCSDDRPRDWTSHEVTLIENIAERTWAAVERLRADEAVRKSEEKFRSLFESIDEGFVIVDMIFDENDRPVDYRFVEANPQFTRLTGLPEDALGKTARELVPDLEDFWFETYGQVALTGESVRFENRSEAMDRWFDVYASRVGGPESRRVAIVFSNVTDRKKAEEALRESEVRFRNMADYAPVMVWVTDESGYCSYLSQTWFDFTGQTPETGLGYGWLDAAHPDDKIRAERVFREANKKAEPFELEYRLRRGDGEYRWAIDSARPRFSDSGVFLGYIGSVIDITERKQAEEARARLAAIVQSSDDAIISKDLNSIITSWNRGAERIFGYTESEAVGKPVTILFPPHRMDEEPGILERIRRGESIDHYETVRRRKDGTLIDISLTVSPIYDVNGTVIGASKVARDITARKEAERRLRETTEIALAAQAKFESVFNQSGIFAGIVDLDGTLREANNLALEVCGYTRDDVLNKPFWETGWWNGSKEVQAKMRAGTEKAAAGERFREILPYWWADGTERVVDFAMHPVRDVNGKVILLHPTGIDITDRIKTEEEIRMISRMPEENPNPVMRVTPSGQILYANPAAKPVINYWETVFGKGIPEDFHWCVAHAFEKNSRETIEVVYDNRFLSCNLAPVREGGYVNVYADDITERQKAEEALRVSEERYRALTELSPQFVFMARPDGAITYVNQFVLDFCGKEYEDLLGDGWSRCIHPNVREAEAHKWLEAVKSGSDYESDVPFLYNDGTYRTVFARAQPVKDENGKVVYWIGTALDIEDRKQAQERLRASESQLRLVTDAIPALVSYIDNRERYQFVNRQYSDWFGRPREDFIGKKMRDVLGTRAYGVVKPHVAEALAGTEVSFDSWIPYKGAGQRYVHVSYVPDHSPDGRVNGLFALVSDLTELKRSEDLLRASQERMKLMTESFTDYAIISTDNEGRIDSWNPGAAQIFGYSEEEILGQPSEILFTPEDVLKGVPLKEMRDARRYGRASDERWHMRKDGSRFFANGAMVPLYIGRTLSGYAKIAADLTERKRNAEALQRAHDQMEMRVLERTRELAEANAALRAEIAERQAAEEQKIALLKRLVTSQEDERRRIARDLHDQLGQRLTALRLKIASLREMVGTDPELQARTNRLQEIGELLDSEVSFLAWELRPSAIEELGLTDAIGTFAREWSRHYGIPAEFHSMGMARLQLDPEADTHLYRIAQEALNNIVKHANASRVNILLEHADGEVILIVEDDGKGFDRQQAKRTRKSGKGLGLTGMEERASLIGGAVEIESSPGSGTTIFARIPLRSNGHK